MDAPPEKKPSRRALLLAVLAVCFTVLATVLLANDNTHLKNLLIHFNLVSSKRFASTQPETRAVERKQIADMSVHIPRHLLNVEQSGARTKFIRDFVVSGKDLCERLTSEISFKAQDWLASPMDPQRFECMGEFAGGNLADPARQSSLFLDIRGEASGKIKSVRIKAVAPPTPEGALITTKLDAALDIIIERTRWSDLAAMREPARRMRAYQAQHFGISVSIRPEQGEPHRLNVILFATSPMPEVWLTNRFINHRR
ncbi:DUF6030 family protein [Agrobacterium pusense]|uniref:DUF6030 family protein n=1 Tax=Agrobacterium pusense TaxID=648995 RepID=UPI003D134A8D